MKALVLIASLLMVPSAFASPSAEPTIVPCLTYAAGNGMYIQKVANDLSAFDSELAKLIEADAKALDVVENAEITGININSKRVVTISFQTYEGKKRSIGIRMDQLCETVGVAYVSKLLVK